MALPLGRLAAWEGGPAGVAPVGQVLASSGVAPGLPAALALIPGGRRDAP